MVNSQKIHLNPDTGDVSKCTANIRECRFGEDNHFDNQFDAHNAYEKRMVESSSGKVLKRNALWEDQKIPMSSKIDKKYRSKTFGEALTKLRTEVETYKNAQEYTVDDFLLDNGYEKHSSAKYYYIFTHEIDTDKYVNVTTFTEASNKNMLTRDAFYKTQSFSDLLDKRLKKNKRHLFIRTDQSHYEEIFSNLPNGFNPIKFGDGDSYLSNVLQVNNDSKNNMFVVLEASVENSELFEKNNASFVAMKGLENSRKILENDSLPDWVALPLKEDSFSYKISASDSRGAQARIEDYKKNYDKYAAEEEFSINEKKAEIRKYERLNKNVDEVISNVDDEEFQSWLADQKEQNLRNIDAKNNWIERIKEESKIKYDINTLKFFAESANEDDREYEFDSIVSALDQRADALGINSFNVAQWAKKNKDSLDMFALARVKI